MSQTDIFNAIISISFDDWVEMYDGHDVNGSIIEGRLCGTTIPTSILSESNEMFIRFHSNNYETQNKGYKLIVEEIGKTVS